MDEKNISVFEPILGKDENVIEVFKPNKIREVLIRSIAVSLFLLIIGGLMFTFGLLGVLGIIEITEEVIDEITGETITRADPAGGIPILIFGSIILLFMLVSILVNIIAYTKRWFCYTNKRIIIRSGVIGVDYKTLDYELIGGISVNVSLLDKLVKPETGTISFASAASPVYQNTKGISQYVFTSIDKPYDVYKRIKEYFDNYKASK